MEFRYLMHDTIGRLRMAMSMVAALALASAAIGHAAPGAPATAAATAAAMPVQSPADIARGKALFTGTCGAYCHRPNTPASGVAVSDAPSLFDCNWIHGGSDTQIFQTITRGVNGTRMVAFGGAIPDEDVWRIIAYLRSASQCEVSRQGNPR